jgi:uncharacterized membrane protein
MKLFITLYICAALVLFPADYFWLTGAGYQFYVDEIGPLLKAVPDLRVALIFYLIYLCGVVILVMKPAFIQRSVRSAALYGALFGLCAYGTYDLTNLATLNGFSVRIAMIDLAWGIFLTSTTSSVGTWLALRILKRNI